MTDDRRAGADTHRHLIEKIYSAAMDPAGYMSFVQAWDAHYLAITGDAVGGACDFDWTDEFLGHLERAGQIFDRLDLDATATLTEQVEAMENAAVVADAVGRAVFANRAAENYLGPVTGRFLHDIAFDQPTREALAALIEAARAMARPAGPLRKVVRFLPEVGEETKIFVADLVADRTGAPPVFFIRSVEDRWHDALRPMLQRSFGMTDAEVELVKSLQMGATIKEIAAVRSRSQATLRTQLKAVLGKMGIHSQVELARIMSGLIEGLSGGNIADPGAAPTRDFAGTAHQRVRQITLPTGAQVEIAESGDLDGAPFYFVQTTTWPTLTPAIVEALANAGIRLISPFRSGVGGTTRLALGLSLADLADYHRAILNELDIDRPLIGGQCSGGIYALALARALGGAAQGVVLVDTGAPLRTVSMVNQMPLAPRRLFLAARYFPGILRTPYKLALKDFYSGAEGESRGVNYFVEGSPHDQASVADPALWQVVRDNFDYVMCNWRQGIQDVVFWASDTTAIFQAAADHGPVTFFQGAQNLLFPPRYLHDLARAKPGVRIELVEDEAQLLIYRRPDMFASVIRAAMEDPSPRS